LIPLPAGKLLWQAFVRLVSTKPANAKARTLLGKLERLADPANGGTPDEIHAARRKLERLRSRFDFSAPRPVETDIFAGIRPRRSARAAHLHTFRRTDFDIANSTKWAIERATGIPCIFRGEDLLAEATTRTANKLAKVALHIVESFRTLLDQFSRVGGLTANDRSLFVRGLYDGMMDDGRCVGEPLPSPVTSRGKRMRVKKSAEDQPPKMAIHPYSVGLGLGKQIRFAAPLEQISAELERATQAVIGPDV
jgi:hypothetical protein